MRINALRYEVAEVGFDDFVCTPDGGLDYHPYLTTHLNGPDWERIYEGIAFANRLGAVLNVHVTIAWERAGICGDDRVSDALVRWAGGFRKWCAARHRPCYYAYVHERSRDHGLHTHLLTSVPQQDKQGLRGWSFNYLRRVAGSAQLPSSAICVRHRGDRDVARQWLWFGYLMKGLSPGVTIHSGGRSVTGCPKWRRSVYVRAGLCVAGSVQVSRATSIVRRARIVALLLAF